MAAPRVFLSYSHDTPVHLDRVYQLTQELRQSGIDAWIDKFDPAPPEGWPRWMPNQIDQADFVLCICTENYKSRFEGRVRTETGSGVNWEGLIATQIMYDNNTQNKKFIAILFDNENVSSIPWLLKPYTWYCLPRQFSELRSHLTGQWAFTPAPLRDPHAERQFIQAAIQAHVTYLQNRLQTPAVEPYKGLFYYELEDEKIFCGREAQKQELLQCITRPGKAHRVTVLHATSGAGKTSLIHAGMMPALLRRNMVPIYTVPRWESPEAAIRTCIMSALPPGSAVADLSALSLHQFLQYLSPGLEGKTLVIFLDQFEDFFIHRTPQDRAHSVRELARCYDDEKLPVKFVIALRKEYFSDLYEFKLAIPSIFNNELKLESLSLPEAAEAIMTPVKHFGVDYEQHLLDRLLTDLNQEGIEPLQLQIVCRRLYEERQHSATITLDDYLRLHEVHGILTAHLSRVIERFGRHRSLAQRVLAALITAEGTKQVLSQKALERDIGDAALEAILQQLVDERLLRQHASADETHYELAHEYLMKEIATWISEKERRHKSIKELLERELSYWRIFGTLIHPDRLQIIEQWLQEPGTGPLSPEGQELIEKSRERRSLDEQEQLQLIQSAKMTSIDQLVMGIDHELCTPIACISSDSQQLRKAVENMRGILEQLPELLLDARQRAAAWPTSGPKMSKQTRDRFEAYIDRYLAALSQQIPKCLRETKLWDITSKIDAIADELEAGAVRTTQLFKALSSFVEPNQTRRKPTDIRTPLEHAQLLLGYELKYHATVRLQHSDSFSVNGSPNQLVQLFMNVLMNSIEAIKAMESRSGSIDMTISHDHISGIVRISDNGIGIPPANREQVFRPGFTTKGSPHRGLGLSIAQQIVRRHNGSLEILAAPQPGTTLEIRLPLSDLGKSYGHQ